MDSCRFSAFMLGRAVGFDLCRGISLSLREMQWHCAGAFCTASWLRAPRLISVTHQMMDEIASQRFAVHQKHCI
jgi:hypothetical protein